MRKEHFEQFDITRNDGNEIPLIPALKLCRAEFPQHRKDLMADDGQNAKGNVVVTVLLAVVQDAAQNRKHQNCGKELLRRAAEQRRELPLNFAARDRCEPLDYTVAAEYRDENGAEKTEHAEQNTG